MDWSTKHLWKEIDDVAQLYALSSCSSMATSMTASLGKKLSTAVSLGAEDYVSLMQHVDVSKLPGEQKQVGERVPEHAQCPSLPDTS